MSTPGARALTGRGSPRLVLCATFVAAAVRGYLLFNGSAPYSAQTVLSFAWGIIQISLCVLSRRRHLALALPPEQMSTSMSRSSGESGSWKTE